jgi:hypothetical protein
MLADRTPVDDALTRTRAAERDVLDHGSIEEHSVAVAVLRNESDHFGAFEDPRGDREATCERAEQLPLPSAFHASDAHDLPCSDDEARLSHA